MSSVMLDPSTSAPPSRSLADRYTALPAYYRWPLIAALGILVLTIVQGRSDTELLTSGNTAMAAAPIWPNTATLPP